MAHLRSRLVEREVRKQLKFWPILTVFGPRQSGKSTFLRELLLSPNQFTYVNLDRIQAREAARNNPEQFLTQLEREPIVIDEAHKCPDLFDEIKATVDEDRRPGRFILTGSVQFSKKIGVRESFTGRAASIRMDSMTMGETTSQKIGLKDIHKYLMQGGMPGVCFLRDADQIQRYWDEWLETTCHRDLLEVSRGKLNSDYAFRILELTSTLDQPTAAEIAKKLKIDARRVKTHLECLESLFLIRKWNPSFDGIGKPMYLPFDSGLASHFKAELPRLWQTWFAHQIVNTARQIGKKDPALQYDLTPRGSFADFIDDRTIHVFNDEVSPNSRLLIRLRALEKRHPKHVILVYSATDQRPQKISNQTTSVPWSQVIETSHAGEKSTTA
jgi:predicted AAA+ superfamily ATPase